MIKHVKQKLMAVLVGLAVTVTAQAAVTTCLIVETNDGVTTNYALSEQPVITYSDGNMLVGTISYAITDVKNCRFSDAEPTTDAQESLASDVKVSYEGGVYTISGLNGGVEVAVFSVSGNKVLSSKSSAEGVAVIDSSSLPQGIYVVKGEGVSFKTIKR